MIVIASFGIGTSLTNDFSTLSSSQTIKSKALNIVIKLATVDGKLCVKISDDSDKVDEFMKCFANIFHIYHIMLQSTGDPTTVRTVKDLLNSYSCVQLENIAL